MTSLVCQVSCKLRTSASELLKACRMTSLLGLLRRLQTFHDAILIVCLGAAAAAESGWSYADPSSSSD